ncbi:hypothetical protein [Streptomyces virginiae]|uniref:hypothetical protein n=1 Tax=Streptomyces virginiae TaxID=1961 RepID=UPI0035DAD8AF
MVIGWGINPYRLDPIQIVAQDRATDGYVIGIRLITNGAARHKVWAMRTVPSGSDDRLVEHVPAGRLDRQRLLRGLQDRRHQRRHRALRIVLRDEQPVRRLLHAGRTTRGCHPRTGDTSDAA